MVSPRLTVGPPALERMGEMTWSDTVLRAGRGQLGRSGGPVPQFTDENTVSQGGEGRFPKPPGKLEACLKQHPSFSFSDYSSQPASISFLEFMRWWGWAYQALDRFLICTQNFWVSLVLVLSSLSTFGKFFVWRWCEQCVSQHLVASLVCGHTVVWKQTGCHESKSQLHIS